MLNTAEQLDKLRTLLAFLPLENMMLEAPTPLGYLKYAVLVQQDARYVPPSTGVNLIL